MNEHEATVVLHGVRDQIVVGPPPIGRVEEAAANRRARRRVALAAAAALVVVAGGSVLWWPSGSDDRAPEPDPAIHPAENPANIPWWGDGRLHLAHAEVEIEQPDFLVPVGDGVVIWTGASPGGTKSPIVHVADDGSRTTIGTRSGGWELAADPVAGLVAWVDNPWSDGPSSLVVYDLAAGAEVARHELAERGPRWQVLDEGPYPIAFEDGVVYYAAQDGDYRWDLEGDGEPERVTDADTYLVSRESGVELSRTYSPDEGYGAPIVGRDGEPDVELPDSVGLLSPDGRYALGLTGIGSYARLFQVATQQRVPTGLTDDRGVVDVAFGTDGTITYAFGTPRTPPEDGSGDFPGPGSYTVAPFDLVTCAIATATCETVVPGIAGDTVVLPD